jgi:short-subunit dehydrogenase involved in D-alanine esterification of teichoic acids
MINKKCVYITCGSSGIGLGLAQFYAKFGNDVVLLARDTAKLDAAVRSCKEVLVNASQAIVGEVQLVDRPAGLFPAGIFPVLEAALSLEAG